MLTKTDERQGDVRAAERRRLGRATIAAASPGGASAIALTFDNSSPSHPNIVYEEATAAKLKFVARANGSWTWTNPDQGIVSSAAGESTSIAWNLGGNAKYSIVYNDIATDSTKLAVGGNGNTFVSATLDFTGGSRASAGFKSDGTITYAHLDSPGDNQLRVDDRASTLLTAPSALIVNGNQICWTPGGGGNGYEVWRATNGAAWQMLGSPASASYTDSTAAAGAAYSYDVRAINTAAATSLFSDPLAVPASPVTVTVTADSATSVSIGWNNVSGESGYRVYRSTDETNWTSIGDTGIDVLSKADTIPTGFDAAFYRVAALSGSNAASVMSPAPFVGVSRPPVLSGSATTAPSVDLSWPPIAAASAYQVETFNTTSGQWVSVGGQIAAAALSLGAADGISAGQSYQFRVKALVRGNWSWPAAPVTVTTPDPAPAEPVAMTLTASPTSDTEIGLSWPEVSGAATYIVTRDPGGPHEMNVYSGGDRLCNDSTLADGTTYDYSVAAYGDANVLLGGGTTLATTEPIDPLPYAQTSVAPIPTAHEQAISYHGGLGREAFEGSRLLIGVGDDTSSPQPNVVNLYDAGTSTLINSFQSPTGVKGFGDSVQFLGSEILVNAFTNFGNPAVQTVAYVYGSAGQPPRLTITGPAGQYLPVLAAAGDDIVMAGINGAYLFDGRTGDQLQSFALPGLSFSTHFLSVSGSDTRVAFAVE